MSMEFKSLKYKIVGVTPGIEQLNIFLMLGQHRVPLLVDGDILLNDSSTTIRNLETISPNKKLIPQKPKKAVQAVLH